MKNTAATLKVGCGKFIYGFGALEHLVPEIRRLGGKPFVMGGPSSTRRILDIVEPELKKQGIVPHVFPHEGQCSKNWAHQYAEKANALGCTVIVAAGGGKCMDLAKCTSVYAGLPIINVPTSIATCVASSAVCIMYRDDGVPDGSVAMEKEVDVVIADSNVIIHAPRRLMAAGIFDSIAKLPEVVHNTSIEGYQDCSLTQYISAVNSKAIYEFLMGEGRRAYDEGESYDRFDDLVLTNLLHTSVVSGFSAGANQLALAHGLYDFMRRSFTNSAKDYLHGEIVAVGILMQLAFNKSEQSYIDEVRALMKHMGLPTTLSQVGFDNRPESVDSLVDYLIPSTSLSREMHEEPLRRAIAQILPRETAE